MDIGSKYEPLREECELVLCKLSLDNETGTRRLCNSVEDGRVGGAILARALKDFPDALWERKMRCLVATAIKRKDENTTLSALNMLHKFLSEGKDLKTDIFKRLSHRGGTGRPKENGESSKRRIKVLNKRLHIREPVATWLEGDVLWKDLTHVTETRRNGESPSH